MYVGKDTAVVVDVTAPAVVVVFADAGVVEVVDQPRHRRHNIRVRELDPLRGSGSWPLNDDAICTTGEVLLGGAHISLGYYKPVRLSSFATLSTNQKPAF